MAELEQVERLREKANVSFAEAKEALDACEGDILDALIYLENQGKATVPAGGGYFSSAAEGSAEKQTASGGGSGAKKGETFGDMLKRFGRFCMRLVNKGNNNFLDATKGGNAMFSCPVTAVVVLLVFFPYIILPLFVISLFIGFRYRFRGAELGTESVNRVMDNAAEVVEDVKKSFGGEEQS